MLASCFPRAERKQAVRPFTHPATVAFGLANLYLLDLTGPLIATDHDLVYHLIGSASSVILPIIVYLVALSLLFTALLYVAERPGALRVIIWAASAVSTRALLDALLQEHLQTPADLETWAGQQK
jgi:hypothetical protein